MGDSAPLLQGVMTGPPPYLKVSRSGTSTEINILSINIQPELDMTLRENHTLIERVAYGMEIFRRKKTQILCMQIKNVDLETIPLCILDYVGFMTFNCFACLLFGLPLHDTNGLCKCFVTGS